MRSNNLVHLGADSLILKTTATVILPLQLVFSMFLLLRGHDEPGGGFIGGLVAAGGLSLYLFAYGVADLKKILRVAPKDLLSVGLTMGLLATVPSVFIGGAFFTAQWLEFSLGESTIKLSTVLLFDVGVYLTVIGTIMTMFLAIADVQMGDD